MFDCASSPSSLSALSRPILLIPPPRRRRTTRIPADGPLFFSGDLLRLTSVGRLPLGAPSPSSARVRVRSDLEKSKDNDDDGDDDDDGGEAEEVRTSFDFLELKREMEKEEEDKKKEELVSSSSSSSSPTEKIEGTGRGRRRGQVTRRSSLLAKQVISVRSARSLGFVSQLWVDTRSWVVVLVEVRPNLLSGEVDKFLLEDLVQVGDVVLVQDESVMENELKMTGLDTLVGYGVVTSGRRTVGKVRGYTFNINSGVVESLELDSFGFSIIPASLVSTYSLLVDNVLEVASDTVVLQEGAVSRVQRITKEIYFMFFSMAYLAPAIERRSRKGIWHNSNVDKSGDDMEEYDDFGRQRGRSAYSPNSRNLKGRRFPRKRVAEDDWELPMDY